MKDACRADRWRRLLLCASAIAVASGCGGTQERPADAGVPAAAPSVAPSLGRVSPDRVAAGGTEFQLSVSGANFTPRTVVRWNGADRPTTLRGPGALVARIPVEDVATAGTAEVSVYDPGPGAGSSGGMVVAIVDPSPDCFLPFALGLHPSGRFAYVSSGGCTPINSGFLVSYSIDPASGALLPLALPALAVGPRAYRVIVDPQGRFVFLIREGDDTGVPSIDVFRVDVPTGALTAIGKLELACPAPSGGRCFVTGMAVAASGNLGLVGTSIRSAPTGPVTTSWLDTYSFDPRTGAPTRRVSTPVASPAGTATIDAEGRFAFVPRGGWDGQIVTYAIDAATGALSEMSSVTSTGLVPAVALSPASGFAFAPYRSSDAIGQFAVDPASGTLTPRGTIATLRSPEEIAVHPSGRFAYVTSSNPPAMQAYGIDPDSGALVAAQAPFAVLNYWDLYDVATTLHPSGKFAYVLTGDVELQVYAIDAGTGALSRTLVLPR